nr:twin-arginine translocase subunit TatC [Euryarchaeota archaeon]
MSHLDGVTPDDSERHVIEHLGEFATRMQRVVLGFLVSAIIIAFVIEDFFAIWLARIPLGEGANSLTIYSPYAWLDAKWSAVGLLAIWVVLPWLLIEFWRFARPGLHPSERNWFQITGFIGIFGGTALVILGWIWGFPRLVEAANTAALAEGVGSHYDVVSLFTMALFMTWVILLLFLVTLSLAVGKALGVVSDDPLDKNRLRLHFSSIVLLYSVTPVPFQGLFLTVAITIIVVSEFFASLAPMPKRIKTSTMNTVLDSEGRDRRVLFIDCSCEGVLDSIPDSFIPQNVGCYKAEALCLDDQEIADLCEIVDKQDVTDIVISGCDGSPTPGTLKRSLNSSQCNLSGLDHLTTLFAHDDEADLQRFGIR